jgi:DNA-binding GntR family transcriptional regulator
MTQRRHRPNDGHLADEPAVPRPPSLAEHVRRVMRDDIVTGRLAPGERLTEAELIKRTGVSRTPVRDGVRRLEAEGLVVSYRGRGTYVAFRLTPEEALLIYDCRLVLEPYLTRRAAERITPEALATIKDVLDRFQEAIGADPAEAGRLDAQFHLAIYEASRSELTSVLRGYWSRIQLELSERVYSEEVPRRFVPEHVEIFEALQSGDAERAGRTMHEHLVHGRRTLERAFRASPKAPDEQPGDVQTPPKR